MAKNWWFKFDWDDWLNDEQLSACSLETQGLWLRCICLMYRSDTAELTGTIEQLRRKLGVLPEELTRCLSDLKNNKAADVRFCKDEVSVVSRRRKRELKVKENNRLYVAKHREKAECKDDVRVQSKSKSKKEEKELVFSDSEKEEKTPLREIHCGNIVARIMKILDVPKLHNHFEWIKQADIAFSLGKTEDEFIETFTLLRGQKWRSGSVKPSTVTDNLPNLTLLRQQDAEINGKPKVKEYSDDERKMREMVLAGKEMFYGR